MPDITHPLRLAVGSHREGSGKGCAMNVISWQTGDTTITDMPACADPLLALIVQNINDTYCAHRDDDMLCPACSLDVLALADRTVGTSAHNVSALDLHRIYIRVSAALATSVLHLAGDARPQADMAIQAATAWADHPTPQHRSAAHRAASAARSAANITARDAASAAANAAAHAAALVTDHADSDLTAAYAATHAYSAADVSATTEGRAARITLAHHAIDTFILHTQITTTPTPPEVTAAAIRRMTATTPTKVTNQGR